MDIFNMINTFIDAHDYKILNLYMRKQDFYEAYIVDEYLSTQLRYAVFNGNLNPNEKITAENLLMQLSDLRREFVKRMGDME